MDDLLHTRPDGPPPPRKRNIPDGESITSDDEQNYGSHHEKIRRVEEEEKRITRERIHIKSLHKQWAAKRVGQPRISPSAFSGKKRNRGRTPSPPRVGTREGKDKKMKKKKKAGLRGSPRMLDPLDSNESSRLGTAASFRPPTTASRLDTASSSRLGTTASSSRLGTATSLGMRSMLGTAATLGRSIRSSGISTASSMETRGSISTPFSKQSVVVGHENPKVLQSFLTNFLNDDLGSFKKHVNLTQHSIDSGTEITDATLQELSDLHPRVEGITAKNCDEITDVGLWALARNCHLINELDFSNCTKITHVGLRSMSLRCDGLRKLSLDGCTNLNDLGLRVLAAGCPGLRDVSLQRCEHITDGGISEIAKCCKSLERLILKGCIKLCEFGDRALTQVGRTCPMLRELDISGCEHVRDGGLRAVARGCPNLEILRCSGCINLTGTSIRALAKGCPHVTSLGLGSCRKLNNQDIWALAKGLQNLQSLSLRGLTKLKCHGIRGLCEWSTNLEKLNLAGCYQVGNDGLTLMGNALQSLQQIDLTGLGGISNNGVYNLCQGCTRLVQLEAGSCKKITRAYLRQLCEELPFVEPAKDRVALIPRKGAHEMIRQTEMLRIHHAAAVVIQKMARGVRSRGGAKLIRFYAQQRFVVPKFQALARGYLTRKHIREEEERKNETVAAILLQRFYRGHKGREKARRARRIYDMQCDQSLAALCVQRVFRGWQGRKRVSKLRRKLALEALQASEERGREEMMAIRIQRRWRARKGYLKVLAMKEMRIEKEKQEFAERMAAMKLQARWRSKLAHREAMRRRAEKILRAREWACAEKLQAAYRGHVARKRAAAERKTRQWKLEQLSAQIIQRAWRGSRGRHIVAIMKSFHEMQARETKSCVQIQSWWRSIIGAQYLKYLKIAHAKAQKVGFAALQIQRIFRGHKGREERDVRVELLMVADEIVPLKMEEKRLVDELTETKDILERRLEEKEQLKIKLVDMETELDEVIKHRSKWYDSANVTGTLQRFETTFLAQALRTSIENGKAAYVQLQKNEIEVLQTKIRAVEKELRRIRRDLLPQETTLIQKIRTERARKLRELIRLKEQSASIIQRGFRAYRVRLATALGGGNWEARIDEGGVTYYFNICTEAKTFERPWAFKVLTENQKAAALEKFAGIVKDAKASAIWSEYFDENTGLPFYFNSVTGEYRWEVPAELQSKRDLDKKDHDWLQRQDIETLTARSARKRDVASGWVEYQDENGDTYYYNAITQQTQWEKPVDFEAEWIGSQDVAALTSRSTQMRRASQWSEYADESNNTYFYNHETEEVSWEKPDDFDETWLQENEAAITARSIQSKTLASSWQELIDPESGYTYYYNNATGESKWSLSPREIEVTPESLHEEQAWGNEETQYYEETPEYHQVDGYWGEPTEYDYNYETYQEQEYPSEEVVDTHESFPDQVVEVQPPEGEPQASETEHVAIETEGPVDVEDTPNPEEDGAGTLVEESTPTIPDQEAEGSDTVEHEELPVEHETENEQDSWEAEQVPVEQQVPKGENHEGLPVEHETEEEPGHDNREAEQGSVEQQVSQDEKGLDIEEGAGVEVEDKVETDEHVDETPEHMVQEEGPETDWLEYYDENGNMYYYHRTTGETRWSLTDDYSQELQAEPQLETSSSWLEEQDERLLTSHSIPLSSVEDSPWTELLDAESNQIYYWNSQTGETSWSLEDALSGSVVAPTEPVIDDTMQAELDRDPLTFTTATRLLEIYYENLSYDPELHSKVERIVYVESTYGDEICQDAEHIECMQWLADYTIKGELLSASGIADHTLGRFEAFGWEY